MLADCKTLGKAHEFVFACVWFAHFQVNGVSPACTWPVVTQRQGPCSLRLLGVQERNPLYAASGAFQPIQLQLRSEVWTGGDEAEVDVDGEVRGKHDNEFQSISHSHTAESKPSSPFMSVIFPLFMKYGDVCRRFAPQSIIRQWKQCTWHLRCLSAYPILVSTLPPLFVLYSDRSGWAAVSQQETLMRCTTELALTTVPPSVLCTVWTAAYLQSWGSPLHSLLRTRPPSDWRKNI